jgi:hypothetical protein
MIVMPAEDPKSSIFLFTKREYSLFSTYCLGVALSQPIHAIHVEWDAALVPEISLDSLFLIRIITSKK